MSWIDNLQDASLRGVPFKVDEDEASFGRRVQIHEYPNRDKPWAEDMGRATRRFSVQAYLVGDDYFEQRNRLIEAVEKPGSCTLVHPFYGEMTVTVTDEVRVSHTKDEGRMCRVSFSFIESGELSFPKAGIATGAKLAGAAALMDDFLSSAFEAFGLDGLPDFTQNGVLDDATEMFDTVTDAMQYVDSGISAASRLMQGDLSVLLMPPSSGMNFVNQLQTMWRAGTKLTGNVTDLISMVKGLSGITLDTGLAPRGVWKTDSASTQARTEQRNYVAQAIRTSALSEAVNTVTNLPKSTALTMHAQAQPSATVIVSHPAVDDVLENDTAVGVITSTATDMVPSWDDLTEVRDTLNTAIDQEMSRVNDDGLFLALRQVRTALNEDITARLEQTSRTVERVPSEVLPAVVLAADWYDDAGREYDITARNAIRHPGFVPVKTLRVPAQ
ncbi:DNA circularization N-terminal domain-containing protein [Klebsiella pneumoniae]|uniref:DNA circularization protein n=1 Tax=Enterobacterales TaxID=91347 RepID=UPI000E5D85DA|nr:MULTISPECIES: DNA circularization N-terminal domain-containing protein [Enterobacterales]MDN2605050.1 DNA circularization N-terminal domain-containing protein [Klebsiella variicola]MDU4746128.1 DNA circularization N-terminal domain-containing protein [Pantoea sp.]AXZ12081.1 DNA circularization protein [Klebsiella pneumoniae]MCQ5470506.1 DNA circularization N-terminal domain-containing protein [Pantoea brenneri]MCS5749524.1 DNA circularization N-terminal domain-containing protein [Klebsiella